MTSSGLNMWRITKIKNVGEKRKFSDLIKVEEPTGIENVFSDDELSGLTDALDNGLFDSDSD